VLYSVKLLHGKQNLPDLPDGGSTETVQMNCGGLTLTLEARKLDMVNCFSTKSAAGA
jgi:hypothetical protein